MKFNEIRQCEILETSKEKRWFSVIKDKVEKIEYGSMEVVFIIKKGEVVSLKVKEKDRTYNIGS
jgi:hypothetical protein